MIEKKDRVSVQAKVFREHLEVKDCRFKPRIFTKNSRFHKKESERRAHSMLNG